MYFVQVNKKVRFQVSGIRCQETKKQTSHNISHFPILPFGLRRAKMGASEASVKLFLDKIDAIKINS